MEFLGIVVFLIVCAFLVGLAAAPKVRRVDSALVSDLQVLHALYASGAVTKERVQQWFALKEREMALDWERVSQVPSNKPSTDQSCGFTAAPSPAASPTDADVDSSGGSAR